MTATPNVSVAGVAGCDGRTCRSGVGKPSELGDNPPPWLAQALAARRGPRWFQVRRVDRMRLATVPRSALSVPGLEPPVRRWPAWVTANVVVYIVAFVRRPDQRRSPAAS